MLGSYSQNVFMSQHFKQHFKTNKTVTLNYFTEEGNAVGVRALNNLQYVLASIDGYRPGKV